MTTVNISLPDSMRDFINEQVEKGGYSTTSEYIRHLIRQDLERVQQSRIEKLLLEGLDSGDAIEITDEWWEQKRFQLIERIRKS
ncbi:type II toxin-antitoxin system ParD family antitoxin [Sphaerospermopsis sp. LEGE 08334]|uniref:type II toxin-antitoxin system ParD family antitoxin n=1 Tax=Sphaerospermopsis sp. LEGE 08334 TaxID=1828651 RepID=UPI001882C136|nr:type II toxin-antitoxin system ParD family antitoxin [Sphaerospermopsis sp. LEGE 08334]MBE9056720.1 type II toxin-antitoxin system ParD family antitoxin [Sphaerospermopsis sp. LEGE 08334]